MKTEILIWIQLSSERCRSKALKLAATVNGVQSVTVAGEERNLLLVIGDGVVDASRLTRRLRNHVGYAEIVELTTSSSTAVPPVDVAAAAAAAAVTEDAVRPRYHGLGGGGGLPWFARVGCPVTAHSVVASHAAPAAALWPGAGEVGGSWAASYSAHPSPRYHSSPLAAVAAVPVRGGGYTLDVARSHAANYSPLIERHAGRGDHYPPAHSCCSRRKLLRRRVPSCCTIQ
uniref:HMA domain-containing protein n=1 Tax=Oryza meridionalis TaxID=40149 RepID=A0A0E0DF45_9ORYZ